MFVSVSFPGSVFHTAVFVLGNPPPRDLPRLLLPRLLGGLLPEIVRKGYITDGNLALLKHINIRVRRGLLGHVC